MRYADWCATFISDYNFSLIIHAYGGFFIYVKRRVESMTISKSILTIEEL